MKSLIIILVICCYSITARSQSYNAVVTDQQINSFMIQVLTSVEPYNSVFNKLPKKLFSKPIHIGKANWRLLTSNESLEFDKAFHKLHELDAFTQDDLAYMKAQYESIRETNWSFEHKKMKLKSSANPQRYFQYSIPLFSKNGTKAMMWRYKYCGSLCAYSELHLYELKDGKWVIEKLIYGWIS